MEQDKVFPKGIIYYMDILVCKVPIIFLRPYLESLASHFLQRLLLKWQRAVSKLLLEKSDDTFLRTKNHSYAGDDINAV